MERDVSNHPTAAQIASGAPLSDEQLAALTDEQRAKLAGREPAPAELPVEFVDESGEFDGGNAPAPHLLLPDAEPDEELDGDVDDSEVPPGADNGFVA